MRRLLPPALLVALACNTGFEPQYRVTDLRILAVRAEVVGSSATDLSPDDTVQLSALVANPRGRGGLEVRWYACAPDGTDRVPPCVDAELLRDPVRLAALAAVPGSGVIRIPGGAEGDSDESPPPIPLASLLPPDDVAAAIAALKALALEQSTFLCRLYVELPLVIVAEAEGRREVALKRVRLVPPRADLTQQQRDAYVLNLNPSLDASLGEGAVRAPTDEDSCSGGALVQDAAFPGGKTVLCGRSASRGPFNICGPNGELTPVSESYSWQWYVDGGEFPEFDGRGNAVGDAVDFERPAGPFTLWMIVRDGRGGESWVEYLIP